MSKGAKTKELVLDRAVAVASELGVGALTIGVLASDLGLSKSGLFAHFGSKEALQLAVIDEIYRRFSQEVTAPALATPTGKGQVRALLEGWIDWSRDPARPGGCPIVGAIAEFDGRPGPVRDRLAEGMKFWRRVIKKSVADAQKIDLPASTSPEEVAMQLIGLYFAQHTYHWLMDGRGASKLAMQSFHAILDGEAARRT